MKKDAAGGLIGTAVRPNFFGKIINLSQAILGGSPAPVQIVVHITMLRLSGQPKAENKQD